jgi:hypothetical protein
MFIGVRSFHGEDDGEEGVVRFYVSGAVTCLESVY